MGRCMSFWGWPNVRDYISFKEWTSLFPCQPLNQRGQHRVDRSSLAPVAGIIRSSSQGSLKGDPQAGKYTYTLGGGLKHFLCIPRSLGTWFNLTRIFEHQLVYAWYSRSFSPQLEWSYTTVLWDMDIDGEHICDLTLGWICWVFRKTKPTSSRRSIVVEFQHVKMWCVSHIFKCPGYLE